MNVKSAKSSPINDSSRCIQRFANGKRCTNFARHDSNFCQSHAKMSEARRQAADLADDLTGGLDKFTSPVAINDFLSRLLLLLAQNRISPRRAAVLAYITNQLLRTLSAIEKEIAPDARKKAAPIVIWDIPGFPRERTEVHEQTPRNVSK